MPRPIATLLDRYRRLPLPLKASVWFLACSVLQRGVSTLTTPLFTRLLTPGEYGEFAVFNSWREIISIVVTLNIFAGGYMQGLVKFDKEREVYSSSMQGLTLTLVAAWSVVYVLFSDFWNRLFSLTTFQMSAMLVIVWASAVFQFWAVEQRVRYCYRTLVALTLAMSVLTPVVEVAFIFWLPLEKVDARIAGLAVTSLAAYAFLFINQVRREKRLYSRFFWRYALAFNIPLVFHYLSQVVLGSSNRIMIDRMVGAREAGIYSLAYSVSLVMTLFNSALGQSLSPWIYTKIKERRLTDMSRVIYISSVLIAAVNLLLIGLAPEIVAVFAPPSYHEAIYVMPPVAMSAYFMFAYDLFAKVAFYREKTRLISTASMVGAVLNVLLNLVFIPLFGYQAAGYTTLICYVAYAVFHYLLMRSLCRRYYGGVTPCRLRTMSLITGAFMLAGFLFLATYGKNVWLRYGLMTGMAVAAWCRMGKIKEYASYVLNVRNRK
ncbi:lipopolysaccharide biosynthesis protein [Phocaeicola plebeius]|uniref:lipopolysaccharide biosynthesis protein n=1 Tax=Phocaeicola plebeius TaxID=310297 RepID=UPI0026F30204|nr:oligosaccharide flippase family protein [Phocaeicola plebeius]